MLSQQIPKTGKIFAYAGVVQDKAPQVRDTAGREQPYTTDERAVYQSKQHGTEKRQTAHTSSRIPLHIKTGLLQKAEENGWTESKVVATACEAYLENDLGEKFGIRLAAQVTDAINTAMQKFSNRVAYLLVHNYKASEENRIISTKVYRYLFGEDTEIYKQIVEDAQEEARDNLKRKLEEIGVATADTLFSYGNRQS